MYRRSGGEIINPQKGKTIVCKNLTRQKESLPFDNRINRLNGNRKEICIQLDFILVKTKNFPPKSPTRYAGGISINKKKSRHHIGERNCLMSNRKYFRYNNELDENVLLLLYKLTRKIGGSFLCKSG